MSNVMSIATLRRVRRNAGWIAPAALACMLITGFALESAPGLSGDTIALVHGAHTISHCLSHVIFTKCDRQGPWTGLDGVSTDVYRGILEGDVGPYPLFQYIPALVAEHLGVSDMSVFRVLEVINLLSFCTVVALAAWLASKTRRRWAPALAVLLITTSPLLFYTAETFGESLAALLMVLFTVAALRRWPPVVIATCAAVCCLTKETAFPIVLLLGAVALHASPVATRVLRRAHWYGLAAGVMVGEIVSTLFDEFRYGQLTNFTYGHSFERVPGVARRVVLAVAMWISPNAGLVIFWGLAGLLVVGLVTATVRRRRRASLTGPALIVALLILTGTLASWYAPFGWEAWGPRLMLPILPATSLIVLVLYAENIGVMLRRVMSARLRAAVCGLAVIAQALPQVNVLHAPQVVSSLFTPDQACPTAPSPIDPSYYYHCLNHYAWGKHWLLLSTFQALSGAWGIVFATAFVAIWACMIGFIYTSVEADGGATTLASARTARWPTRSVPGSAR